MALRWKSSYSCNIKEIDEQHKKMFEIGSKLCILEPVCSKVNFDDEISEIIADLKAYTIYHFTFEENLMKESNFEDYEAHFLEHQHFVSAIQALDARNRFSDDTERINTMIHFIDNWIGEHILKEDMKYASHLSVRSVL